MYRDTPYAQIPIKKSKHKQEKTHVIYERLQASSKQQWMDEEETRYKRIRTESTRIANTHKEETDATDITERASRPH